MAGGFQYLDWDSTFFGIRIGRIQAEHLDPVLVAEARQWAARERIACVYFLADANHRPTADLAHEHGFHLTDVRVRLQRPVTCERPGSAWAGEIRAVRSSDVPTLRSLAAVNHRQSRFYSDSRFPADRCDELFATWIEKSCTGYADGVVIAEVDEEIAGYVTLHDGADGDARIGLFGVSPPARGTGCAGALMHAALRWFRSRSVGSIQVVTQTRNIAALRLYQRCGFVVCDIKRWYHWWPASGEAA